MESARGGGREGTPPEQLSGGLCELHDAEATGSGLVGARERQASVAGL